MTSKTVPTLFFTSPLLQVPLMGQSVSTASAAEEAAEAAAAAPIKDSNPPSRPRWDTDMLLRTANTTANTATTACVPACVPTWRPCWVRCLHDAEPAVAAFPLEVRVALDLALQALPRHHVTGSQPHLVLVVREVAHKERRARCRPADGSDLQVGRPAHQAGSDGCGCSTGSQLTRMLLN